MPIEADLLVFIKALSLASSSEAGLMLLDRFENMQALCKRTGHLLELKLRSVISEDTSGTAAMAFMGGELGLHFVLAVDGLSKSVLPPLRISQASFDVIHVEMS